MGKIKQIRRLKKGWKIFGAAMVALLVVTCCSFVMAVASSDVRIQLSVNSTRVYKNTTNSEIIATPLGNDENTVNGQPLPERIEWSVLDETKVAFQTGTSENPSLSNKVTGANPVLYGRFAGKTTVSAKYYTKRFDENGIVIPGSTIMLDEKTVSVVVPLEVEFSYNGSESIPNILPVGATIYITANTNENNQIIIETGNGALETVGANDGIVKLTGLTHNTATLEVIGGGETRVSVRTQDNTENNQDLIVAMNKPIRGKVAFLDGQTNANAQGHYIKTSALSPSNRIMRYIVLDETDFVEFTEEEIPSNILNHENAGVTYEVDFDYKDIASYVKGQVKGQYAGVVRASIGIYDYDTNGVRVPLTEDKVNIVVPFKKLGHSVSNVNVGDQMQFNTTGKPGTVSWNTSDSSILTVTDTGLVTAHKAGKATITASIENADLLNVYGLPTTIKYEISVIDGFGLSDTEATVNIGESISIEALVTTDDLVNNPITFRVENLANDSGVVPTETLVTTVQDGKKLTITGVASGKVKVTATQTVNGVIKSASCVVYVTTPVGEMIINPSSIQIDRGETGVVQLLFNPAGPSNDNVLWGTSNPNVATVEGDSHTATITGVAGGTATITVVSEDGLKVATCDVYIREPVTGIVLNATTVEGKMSDGRFQLVATVLPSGEGVNRNVTWISSDPSVATVDENGLVTYHKPGYANIVCQTQDGGFIATCNFIIQIPVESITLDYTDEILRIGDTLRITAEILPVEASNRYVYWESSNTNVCVVDSNGLVEAIGTGSCTILCKSADGALTAMCNIYVKQPVQQIILNTTDITVRKGQVFWLNATCLPENADNKVCSWESRNEDVVKVEQDGKCTATGAGTTSVIVTNVDTGLTAFCVVTVIQPVTGIKLNSDYQLMWVGSKYAIIPTVEPADAENKNVTYYSSDSTVASVDDHGVVTALKGGTTIITVTTEECQLVATCTIEVKEYVSTITLSEEHKFMNVGATGTLIATVGTDTATNKNIIWSSSNDEICSVDQKGNLTAHVPGIAVITATAADGSGVTASCVVQVVNPVTSIEVVPSTVRLLVGDSVIVKANVYPENASIKDVTWTSSNESIAVVDEAGEIFALGTGKCKVTATSMDGNEVKGVCWVYVTPVVNISSIKISSSEIYMLCGKSRQLSVRVRPAVNTDEYNWYSSDTGIVVVDDKGLISTVGPGTAEVVCESVGNGVSGTCIVHSIGISRSNITLEQYDSYWLDILGVDDKVTWRSSNPRVCTVSSSGQVIARMAGTTTVTAVVRDKTLYCTVTVTNFR